MDRARPPASRHSVLPDCCSRSAMRRSAQRGPTPAKQLVAAADRLVVCPGSNALTHVPVRGAAAWEAPDKAPGASLANLWWQRDRVGARARPAADTVPP